MKTLISTLILSALFVPGSLFAQYSIQYFDDASEVSLTQQGVFTVPIQKGLPLLSLDSVATDNSQLEFLTVGENTALVINEKTEFTLPDQDSQPGIGSTMPILLSQGKLRTIVASNANPINIDLGSTRVSATYGEFIVGYNDDNSIEVTSYYGDIRVTDPENGIDELVTEQSAIRISNNIVSYLEQDIDQLARKINEIPFQGTNIRAIPGYQEIVPPERTIDGLVTAGTRLKNTFEDGALFGAQEWIPNPDKAFSLRMNVGLITIGEHSYGSANMQPHIRTKNFRATFNIGFAIRSGTDATDPTNWYRPWGNLEWDFGATHFKTDLLKGTFDLINDVLLKINILEVYKDSDPFYLRLGTLDPLYVGTGSLIGGYTNSPNYPFKRRSGAFLNANLNTFGFFVFAESITNKSLYGGRFYLNPRGKTSKAQFGLTLIADLGLSTVLDGLSDGALREYQVAKNKETGYLAGGIDFWMPIIFPTSSVLNIVIDGNFYFPYNIEDGVYTIANNSIWEPSTKSVPGLASLIGFGGENSKEKNVSVSYLFSFQYLGSITLPRTIGPRYDRNRLFLIKNFVALSEINEGLATQEQDNTISAYSFGLRFDLGITGNFGYSISASYFLPMTIENDILNVEGRHELYFNFDLHPETWPFTLSVYANFHDVVKTFTGEVPFLHEYTDIGASLIASPFDYLSFEIRGGLSLLEDTDGYYTIDPTTNRFASGGTLLFLINLHI